MARACSPISKDASPSAMPWKLHGHRGRGQKADRTFVFRRANHEGRLGHGSDVRSEISATNMRSRCRREGPIKDRGIEGNASSVYSGHGARRAMVGSASWAASGSGLHRQCRQTLLVESSRFAKR